MNGKILIVFFVVLGASYFFWNKYKISKGRAALVEFICKSDAVSKFSDAMGPTLSPDEMKNMTLNDINGRVKTMQTGMQQVQQVLQTQKAEIIEPLRALGSIKDKKDIEKFSQEVYADATAVCRDKVTNTFATVMVVTVVVGMAGN